MKKYFLTKGKYQLGLLAVFLMLAATVGHCLFSPMSRGKENIYIYIDGDDILDSVRTKLSENCHRASVSTFLILSRHCGYGERIHPGRYELTPDMGALQLIRHMRNGQQSPLRLVLPQVRTASDLSRELSERLLMSKDQMEALLTNNDSLSRFGVDTATVMALFVPNTYEVYWTISPVQFLKKMKAEHEAFWKGSRTAKAEQLNLTPFEVSTLASIIDEETANNPEKPMVAGMYYNRLKSGMPLQADPTVKFALKQFALRRIYKNMLQVDSPYNTYVNTGLPPGPIRIASVAGIDAVLNLVHHDYLYMCAKEDFSGTHNFARTYGEHLQNAARYSKALNERGIK